MSSVDEQLANVAAFHQLSEKLPGLTIEEWRKLVGWQKSRQSVWVTVGDLRVLLDEVEALRSKHAACCHGTGTAVSNQDNSRP